MAAKVTGSLLLISFLCLPVGQASSPAPKAPPVNGKAEKSAGDEKTPAGDDSKDSKDKGGDASRKDAGKEAPPPDAGKAVPQGNDAKPAGKAEAKAKAAPVAPAPRVKPTAQLKTPQATEKFLEGLKKFDTEDYTGARAAFNACLKDAATPADKKVIQAYIEDTKVGTEIVEAKKMVERKDERKAISRVEKALKANPTTYLRPEAEKFIQETEEIIFLVLDDFEPGDALQKETDARGASNEDDPKGTKSTSGRWRANHFFNSDPRFVKHGKGSMKWKVGGAYSYGGYSSYYYDSYSYRSMELKNSITKWHALVFWIYMAEADEGSLRVSLSPTTEAGITGSLYSGKLIDLRGQRGWKEIRLDLNRDFGNTRNVKLEDIHYVRIEYIHVKSRTLYLDFVHFE